VETGRRVFTQERSVLITATPPRTSAQSTPINTARSAEQRTLEDAVHVIGVGATGLDWLDSVLHAIEVLNEQGGGSIHIKYLAELGQYITSDFGGSLDSEREKFTTCANAKEVMQ